MDFEVISAFCFMPLLMVIAAQGWVWMTCVFICFPIFFALYQCKLPKMRTRFFVAWSIVSFFFLLAVFELEVVPYLEILFIENFILMCFVAVMCLCVYMAKYKGQEACILAHATEAPANKAELQTKRTRCELCSVIQPPRTYHCDICGYCIHLQDHHNVWLDICIGAANKKYFVGAILTLLCACLYSSNLTLTTICHPTLVGNLLLMPDDCSDVFGDIHVGICFASAVYTLIIAVFAIYLLCQQIWLISHNATYQEWNQGILKLHSNGFLRNWLDFCCGYPKIT